MADSSSSPVIRYGDVILPPDPLGMWATTPEEIKPGYEIYTSLTTEGQHGGSNSAEYIRGYLEADKHQVWGWVIYRCTYESDEDWAKLMDIFHRSIKIKLERCGGLDLLDSCHLTVIEDKDTLDDASTAVVREHFKQWCMTAPQNEQGGANQMRSQRYQFCVQVDDESINSILYEAPPPEKLDKEADGYVNLIWKYWHPDPPELREARERRKNQGGYEPKYLDDGCEEIEGCRLQDVEWLRAGYQVIFVRLYSSLRERGDWYVLYRRPGEAVLGDSYWGII
jgi:hypothetical protein